MKFKVGDTVKIIKNIGASAYNKYIGESSVITQINGPDKVYLKITGDINWEIQEIELIKSSSTMSSLLKRAKDLFIQEPQKSLRKTGIFDDTDTVTDEGIKVYVTALIVADTAFQDGTVKALADAIDAEAKK